MSFFLFELLGDIAGCPAELSHLMVATLYEVVCILEVSCIQGERRLT